MAPDQDPILNAAHVATLAWDSVTDCELLRRSHEALREQVRVLTNMHRQAVAAADELRASLRDVEDDARPRFDIERAALERRVCELEGAISKLLAWSEFAFPRGEPAAIRDARAALARWPAARRRILAPNRPDLSGTHTSGSQPCPDRPMSSRAEDRPSTR